MISGTHILKGLENLFIKVYFIFKYVYVPLWDYVHVSAGTCQGQTRRSDALKLNMWVLGTKLICKNSELTQPLSHLSRPKACVLFSYFLEGFVAGFFFPPVHTLQVSALHSHSTMDKQRLNRNSV